MNQLEQHDRERSLWSSDRLAYMAVIAGAASLTGDRLFDLSPEAANETFAWYLVAVPMLALAAYTVISGIYLRFKIAKLGDFGEIVRHETK